MTSRRARLPLHVCTRNGGAQAPGGKYNAFVRNNNLYVEDVASKKERALTTDGSEAA